MATDKVHIRHCILYEFQQGMRMLQERANRFVPFSAKVLYRTMCAHFGLSGLKAVISV